MNRSRRILTLCISTLAAVACFDSGGSDDGDDDNNNGTPGFGDACDTNADCSDARLLCDRVLGCVECLGSSDCASGDTCTNGVCREAPSACDACPSGTVCAADTGECVQCLGSSDCSGDDVCIGRQCQAPVGCEATSDCTGALLCDTTIGRCVECLADNHCPAGQVCSASSCVSDGSGGTGGTGSGGTGGGGGTGGADATGGTSSGGTGNGGTNTGGQGGSGTGGSSGCSCTGGEECATDGRCIDPAIIDDFADCDTAIYPIRGRNGGWYASADVGINVSFAVSMPPSGFSDRRCGAWTTGGPTGNGSTNYGILGVGLTTTSSAVDLSAYDGVAVSLEGMSLDFVVKTTDGGYFTARLPATAGSQTFEVDFASLTPRSDSAVQILNPTRISDFQFAAIDPSVGYGWVVHALRLF
jgi:Cys-rich repeat protein